MNNVQRATMAALVVASLANTAAIWVLLLAR